MCTVSMVMDWKSDEWQRRYWPWPTYPPLNPLPLTTIPVPSAPPLPLPTQGEIAEFQRLLERARAYDKANNEPDCELESKRQRLRKLAADLGVEISFV